jgi:hypothetical protein
METKKKRISETKRWFFEKIRKIAESLTKLTKRKIGKAQISKIRDERGRNWWAGEHWRRRRVNTSKKASSPGHRNGGQEKGEVIRNDQEFLTSLLGIDHKENWGGWIALQMERRVGKVHRHTHRRSEGQTATLVWFWLIGLSDTLRGGMSWGSKAHWSGVCIAGGSRKVARELLLRSSR